MCLSFSWVLKLLVLMDMANSNQNSKRILFLNFILLSLLDIECFWESIFPWRTTMKLELFLLWAYQWSLSSTISLISPFQTSFKAIDPILFIWPISSHCWSPTIIEAWKVLLRWKLKEGYIQPHKYKLLLLLSVLSYRFWSSFMNWWNFSRKCIKTVWKRKNEESKEK